MKWYNKYTSIHIKQFNTSLLRLIRTNFKALNNKTPIASVIIIAHNEEANLQGCLWSLSENICKYPLEFIGIDNNSTDRTGEIFEASGINWYKETREGPGYARQCGLNQATGKYYISIDSDVIYPPHYIETMVDYLEKGYIVVFGHYGYIPDGINNPIILRLYEIFRDVHLYLYSIKRPELSARGAVMSYNIQLGKLKGYRTNIKCGEDGAMLLNLKEHGKFKFLYSKKTRAVTYTRTLLAKGPLARHFLKLIKTYIKKYRSYFTSQKEYENQENNLIEN